jgi:hypothetical protein
VQSIFARFYHLFSKKHHPKSIAEMALFTHFAKVREKPLKSRFLKTACFEIENKCF